MSRVLIVDRDMSRLWRVTHAVARQGLQVTPTLEGIRCIRLLRTTDQHTVEVQYIVGPRIGVKNVA